jgi:hypothetical protein
MSRAFYCCEPGVLKARNPECEGQRQRAPRRHSVIAEAGSGGCRSW